MELTFTPYTPVQYFSASFLLLVSICGLVLEIVILTSIIWDRARKLNSGNILLIGVGINAFFLTVFGATTSIYNLVYGGYAWNFFWCDTVWTNFLLFFECSVVLTVIALVVDLYLLLICRIYSTAFQGKLMVFSMWIISGLVMSIQYILDTPGKNENVTLQSGHLVCMVDFTNKSSRAIISIALCLGIVTLGVFFVCYTYLKIFLLYFKSNRDGQWFRTNIAMTDLEKTLLFRSVSVFSAFIIFWTPYLIKIIIEVASSAPVSSEYDCFATIMFALFDLSTVLLMVFQDGHLRRSIYTFLNVKPHQQRQAELWRKNMASSVRNLQKSVLPRLGSSNYNGQAYGAPNNSFLPQHGSDHLFPKFNFSNHAALQDIDWANVSNISFADDATRIDIASINHGTFNIFPPKKAYQS